MNRSNDITYGDEDCGFRKQRMATSQFNSLNPDEESIKTYLERVDLYFTANTVPANKQVLTSIGSSTYALLSNLLAPDTPKSKSLNDISTILKKYFETTRAIIAERFHFHKRQQAPAESITEYDAALRKLATHCNFGAYLEDALRDRFVCGLQCEAMQRRLLSEVDLTLKKAMELAQGMEAAASNTRSIKGADPAIRNIIKKKPTNPSQPCYRCGKSNHYAADCRFKDAECHQCGKKGHIAPACRSKDRANPNSPWKGKRKYKTHHVEHKETDTTDSENELFHVFKLAESSSRPIKLTVQIEDKPLKTLERLYPLFQRPAVRPSFPTSSYVSPVLYLKHTPMNQCRSQANSMSTCDMEVK